MPRIGTVRKSAQSWHPGDPALPGNRYTTADIPLAGYQRASRKVRAEALKRAAFLRTWCKDKGKGEATNVPPTHLKGKEAYLWK